MPKTEFSMNYRWTIWSTTYIIVHNNVHNCTLCLYQSETIALTSSFLLAHRTTANNSNVKVHRSNSSSRNENQEQKRVFHTPYLFPFTGLAFPFFSLLVEKVEICCITVARDKINA